MKKVFKIEGEYERGGGEKIKFGNMLLDEELTHIAITPISEDSFSYCTMTTVEAEQNASTHGVLIHKLNRREAIRREIVDYLMNKIDLEIIYEDSFNLDELDDDVFAAILNELENIIESARTINSII